MHCHLAILNLHGYIFTDEKGEYKSAVVVYGNVVDSLAELSTCSYEFNNARFVLVGRLK